MHYINTTNVGPCALGTYPNETRLMEFQTASEPGDTYFDDQTGYTYIRVKDGVRVRGISDQAPKTREEYAERVCEELERVNGAVDLGGAYYQGISDRGNPIINGLEIVSPKEWRCFHCDALFRDYENARAHFGESERYEPICTMSPNAIREMEAELDSYRAEDTALHRQIHAMAADHATKLREEEEKGYARGLKDGRECRTSEFIQKTIKEAITEMQQALTPPLVKVDGCINLIDTGKPVYQHKEVSLDSMRKEMHRTEVYVAGWIDSFEWCIGWLKQRGHSLVSKQLANDGTDASVEVRRKAAHSFGDPNGGKAW